MQEGKEGGKGKGMNTNELREFIGKSDLGLFLGALKERLTNEPELFSALSTSLGLGLLPEEREAFIAAIDRLEGQLANELIDEFLRMGDEQ